MVQRVGEEHECNEHHVDRINEPFLLSGSLRSRLRFVRQLKQPEHDKTDQPQEHNHGNLPSCREAHLHLNAVVNSCLTPASGMLAVMLEDVVLLLPERLQSPQHGVVICVRVVIDQTVEFSRPE